MIIGIDGNEANVNRRVGIGEYAYQLLCQFYRIQKLRQKNQDSSLVFHIYLKEPPLSDMPKEDTFWKYLVVGPKKMWTQIGLPFRLFFERNKPDVFFTPSHYAPRFALMPTAIAIMDLAYIRFPEMFAERDLYQLTHWTGYSAKHARRIFTISNSTKNDIIQEYRIDPERIIVTYLGIKHTMKTNDNRELSNLQETYHLTGDYILFVGTLQPRKNLVRLIEAFSLVKQSFTHHRKAHPLQLVLVGKKGWLYEEILTAPETFGVQDSVKFLDFVPDADLPALYRHALFYILPSLYEGFGLPVLEAMKYGCPVITSDISSLPEAGGSAALYVNPENVQDIAKKMSTLISDKTLREEMRKKGLIQIKKFSWEKTATETLAVLEDMVEQK